MKDRHDRQPNRPAWVLPPPITNDKEERILLCTWRRPRSRHQPRPRHNYPRVDEHERGHPSGQRRRQRKAVPGSPILKIREPFVISFVGVLWLVSVLLGLGLVCNTHAFVPTSTLTSIPKKPKWMHATKSPIPTTSISLTTTAGVSRTTTSVCSMLPEGAIEAAVTTPTQQPVLANYAVAATSLFNNMKLPAAVVTAGMISLGFATSFPELPKKFPSRLRTRCEALKRLHIVVSLVAVTSELIVVMWSAVEVNQLTEKDYAPALSVWDLIQRDCDLAWSAVNSHFVLGIIGFVTMLAFRGYVMLLAAEASDALMMAASTGTASALCLMLSVVNRGVESGGGDVRYRYGNTIVDLLTHYVTLLAQAATDRVSPGPLQLSAILLELVSLVFMANVLFFRNGKMKYINDDINDDDANDEGEEREMNGITFATMTTTTTPTTAAATTTSRATMLEENNDNEVSLIDIVEFASSSNDQRQRQREYIKQQQQQQQQQQRGTNKVDDNGEEWDSGDTSVSIY